MVWLILWGLIQSITVSAGTPVTLTLSAGAGPADVLYTAALGDVLTVTARSTATEPIDVTLEILLDDERIAFNDDHLAELSDIGPQDSAITNLLIDEAGDYTLRIHSFSGAQSGEIEVLVQSRPLIESCLSPAQAVELQPHRALTCLLDLEAGQTVTLTARDTSGTLDPVLGLLDAGGTLLARSDDHASADLTLNVLDAQIAGYEVDEAGIYTVRVSDFGGAAGTLELHIEIES